MDSVVKEIIDKANHIKNGNESSENSLDFDITKLKKQFYFENLNDDEFFTQIGTKESFLEFYQMISKCGLGAIILGGNWIGLNKNNSKSVAKINNENQIMKAYSDVVKAIHRSGSTAYLKLKPAFGREIDNNLEFGIFQTTSGFNRSIFDSRISTLRASDGKIYNLIEDVCDTIKVANIIGFDGVVIDATFSNLFGELSSNETNKRGFGYFSNHAEFLIKTVNCINKKCKNTKIIVKISVFSLVFAFFDKSNTIKTISSFRENFKMGDRFNDLVALAKVGVDGFEFEFGVYENEFLRTLNQFISPDIFDEVYKSAREYLKENFKEKDLVLFYNNSYAALNKSRKLLENNIVDYVNITKNILADKDYVYKLSNGLLPKECLRCNYCDEWVRRYGEVKCVINPELKSNDKYITKSVKKSVAVIGSGVAGLLCSLTLASRDFVVKLYEKNNNLNINGKICTIYNFDELLNKYYFWLENEINKFVKQGKIVLNLNKEISANDFQMDKFDVIVIATGFKQKCLLANGAIQPHVKSIYDVLSHKEIFDNKKNIVILAKTELSLKLALYLIINNFNVSILISNLEILKSINHSNLTYYLYQFNRLGVKIYLETKIKKINEDNIDFFVNKNLLGDYVSHIHNILSCRNFKFIAQAVNLDCDLFVYEPELIPNNKLYYDFVNSGYKGELYLIGQALEEGDLANDIESGYYVGKNI